MRMRMAALALAALTGAAASGATAAQAQTAAGERSLTVLSFNIWWGGTSGSGGLERTLEVIRRSGAAVVGIQEKMTWDERGDTFGYNSAQDIAQALGWDYVDQTAVLPGTWNDTAIVSRHPILALSPNHLCVTLDVEGQAVNLCNIHLYSAPYQPYQLSGIPYRDAPLLSGEAEAIEAARAARGAGIDALLRELEGLDGTLPTVILGDFNEPSHRDWTEAAAAAGRHPLKVAYPQTQALEAAGFTDAYRAVRPDEVAHPGFTWTPNTAENDPADHHDRIDFIFVRGEGVAIENAVILGEAPERADIVVTPWPSDHRAVAATLRY